ncbi:unnamed protein product [Symbiodinium necroappetens]|uniref:Uncharacterized protein n=1 Tax=Symbiodinium necroappetens TaxID=1628268 RepID=A0A813A176_9DINO|nr:unnamed protein product [Symbiodinium necroappetens]
MTLREQPQPAIMSSSNISYHGQIKDDAEVCWVSFPGAYASGWEALVGQHNADSVACVFLTTPEDGFGKHADDPKNPGQCYCSRIYGRRDHRQFGYLQVFDPTDTERRQQLKEIARVTKAVLISSDATEEAKAEAERQAVEQWRKCGCVASWGCQWFHRWLHRVREAVSKGQKLKAVFFPGQVGEGIPSMDQLRDPGFNPWDGVGCGGSQKAELATLHEEGWSFEGVDVTQFLQESFNPESIVDALSPEGSWKRSIVVEQLKPLKPDKGLPGLPQIHWRVRCHDGHGFVSSQLRHTTVAVDSFRTLLGRGPRI